ncbi:MAG: M16 family metallopeptidase [Anaplasma sp.]
MRASSLLLCILGLAWVLLVGTECIAAKAHVDVRSASTKGGVNYWYVEEHGLPIVSVSIALKRAGAAYDPRGKSGLAYLASTLLPWIEVDEGKSVTQKLGEKGIDLSVSVDLENVYVSLKTLSHNLDEALDALGYCLSDLEIGEEIFERAKERQKAEARQSATEPSDLAAHGIARVVFGDHPYGRPIRGMVGEIDGITVEDVLLHRKESFDLDQLVIGVVGDVDVKSLSNMLDKHLSRLGRGQNKKVVGPVEIHFGRKGYIKHEAPQSVVMFSGRGVPLNDPRYHAMQLLNNALGGTALSSVLMRELREKLGITYHVSSFLFNEGPADLLCGILYTDNSTAKQGVEGLVRVVNEIKTHGLDEQSFGIAKADIQNSFVFSLLDTGAVSQMLMKLQLQGRGLDYISSYRTLFDSISLQDVNAVAKEVLGDLSVVEVGIQNNLGGDLVLQ